MTHQAVSYQSYEADSKTSSIKKNENAGTLVVIEDYNPAYHSLKLVRLSDGKPLRSHRSTETDLNKSKPFEQSNAKTLKTLPAPDGPILEVNDHQSSVRGSSTNGFYSYREFGNVIKGPTSLSAQPHEIRVGGLMTFHPLLTSGFPSTIVTPIPTFQWSLPSGAMLGPIAKDIALMSTLIGIIA
jgi:hypothetical protein